MRSFIPAAYYVEDQTCNFSPYPTINLIVMYQYGTEPDGESLFLLCGRRTGRIKALFSGDGHILLYKRLNNGRFQWPRSEAELRKLDAQAFRTLCN